MKDLGFTLEGNRIIEISRDEYDELAKLCNAVEGRNFPWLLENRNIRFEQGFDFTKTFEVIRAYYTNKFHLNEIQGLLNDIRSSLDKKE